MSLEKHFRNRAKEVRAYLSSLMDIESQLAKSTKLFYRSSSMLEASRASAFSMIYNCVEFAVVETIASVRAEISNSGISFHELQTYWRNEILRFRYSDKLAKGCNHDNLLSEFRDFIPGSIGWSSDVRSLPFSGNIDHQQLIAFVGKLGKKWKPPKSTLGGSDLNLIRNTRNALAHGDDSFQDVGRNYTAHDLIEKFDRIRIFIIGFIRFFESYKRKKAFR